MYTPPTTAMMAASNPFLESFPLTATIPPVDLPDIENEARVTFADAMPTSQQTIVTGMERENKKAPRQNIFHIANMNFNADELRRLCDIVYQIELASLEPEEVTV
jgi:hypothetical protein